MFRHSHKTTLLTCTPILGKINLGKKNYRFFYIYTHTHTFFNWKGNKLCSNTTGCKSTREKNPNKLWKVKPTKQEVKIRCFHCSVKSPPVKCKVLHPGERSSASARSIRQILWKGTLSWKITNEVYFSNKWLLVKTAKQNKRLWI